MCVSLFLTILLNYARLKLQSSCYCARTFLSRLLLSYSLPKKLITKEPYSHEHIVVCQSLFELIFCGGFSTHSIPTLFTINSKVYKKVVDIDKHATYLQGSHTISQAFFHNFSHLKLRFSRTVICGKNTVVVFVIIYLVKKNTKL